MYSNRTYLGDKFINDGDVVRNTAVGARNSTCCFAGEVSGVRLKIICVNYVQRVYVFPMIVSGWLSTVMCVVVLVLVVSGWLSTVMLCV